MQERQKSERNKKKHHQEEINRRELTSDIMINGQAKLPERD